MTSYKKDLIRNRIVIRALDNDSLSNHLQIKPDIKFEEAVWEALHFILPLSLSASRVCSLPSSKCWEPFSEAALQAEWLWARLLCESFFDRRVQPEAVLGLGGVWTRDTRDTQVTGMTRYRNAPPSHTCSASFVCLCDVCQLRALYTTAILVICCHSTWVTWTDHLSL